MALPHPRAPPVTRWLQLPVALAEQRSPLCSSSITELSSLLRAAPPLRSASVLSPSRLEPLVACSLASENKIPPSLRKPLPPSRHLHAGCHSGRLRHPPKMERPCRCLIQVRREHDDWICAAHRVRPRQRRGSGWSASWRSVALK